MSLSLGAGSLLWVCGTVLQRSEIANPIDVPDEFLKELQRGRVAVNGVLERALKEGKDAVKLLLKEQSYLENIDASVALDIALQAAVSGEGGRQLARKKLITMMPTNEKHVAMDELLGLLRDLRAGPLCTHAKGSQRDVATAIEILESMSRGKAPDLVSLGREGWLREWSGQLQWLASFTDNAENATVGYGKVAIAKMYKALLEKNKAGSLLISDIVSVQPWTPWLSQGQRKEVSDMASKLLSHMRGAKRQLKGAPDKPAKQAKKAAASSKPGAAVAGGSGSGSSSSTLSPGMAALFKDLGARGS